MQGSRICDADDAVSTPGDANEVINRARRIPVGTVAGPIFGPSCLAAGGAIVPLRVTIVDSAMTARSSESPSPDCKP